VDYLRSDIALIANSRTQFFWFRDYQVDKWLAEIKKQVDFSNPPTYLCYFRRIPSRSVKATYRSYSCRRI
jgi:hypothetical protein